MLVRAYAAHRYTARYEARMNARYDVTRNETGGLIGADLARAAQGAEVLFISLTEAMSDAVIASLAPTLKVICTLSVGTDHIDLEAARQFGVTVLNTPDVVSVATAEIAILLMLNACRRAREGEALVRSGAWAGWRPTQLLGLGLNGRRLGILGLGRVGREVAKRARGFDLEIHYHNRNRLTPPDEAGAIYHGSADELLRHSDIFCIAAPSTPQLKGFLDARRIDLLPRDAVVVNVARGDMVVDGALIAALKSGRIFAAGLDVYRGEPDLAPAYRALDNVFLMPHLGSATIETRDAMGMLLLDGLEAIEAGRRPANQVF